MSTRKRPTKRQRLERLVSEYFRDEMSMDVRDVRLYPATGFWRTSPYADVYRIDGFAKWHGDGFTQPLTITVVSWCSMTELLRKGFKMSNEFAGTPLGFELEPIEAA